MQSRCCKRRAFLKNHWETGKVEKYADAQARRPACNVRTESHEDLAQGTLKIWSRYDGRSRMIVRRLVKPSAFVGGFLRCFNGLLKKKED